MPSPLRISLDTQGLDPGTLRYPINMCPSVYVRLMLGCYCGGCLNSILQASFTFTLPFCNENK